MGSVLSNLVSVVVERRITREGRTLRFGFFFSKLEEEHRAGGSPRSKNFVLGVFPLFSPSQQPPPRFLKTPTVPNSSSSL